MGKHYVVVQEFDGYFGLLGKETFFHIGKRNRYKTDDDAKGSAIEFAKGLPIHTEVGIKVVRGKKEYWIDYNHQSLSANASADSL